MTELKENEMTMGNAVIHPKIRGYICTTAHPMGCERNVLEQIEYVKSQPKINGPKKVLVVGASTGYGLASRVVAAFGSGAGTMGVFFEKAAENKKTATAGWYNSVAFDKAAHEAGLFSKSFNGDAFSAEMKNEVITKIKKEWGDIDLLVYSLASPRRLHPVTAKLCKSTLKPCGAAYTNKSIDFMTDKVITVTLPPATGDDVEQTVSVMGGEDWQMWMDALRSAGVLAQGFFTVAYSYVGPDMTNSIYRKGTIGAAKDHLEATAKKLDQELISSCKGHAYVSVNKALVTQSSAAIPFIPLYFTLLMKVMKPKGLHEDCIQQMYRLFSQRLFAGKAVPVDEQGRIRIDDWEMRPDVQADVKKLWESVSNENVKEIADINGYHADFLRLFGFGRPDVNYDAQVQVDIPLAE